MSSNFYLNLNLLMLAITSEQNQMAELISSNGGDGVIIPSTEGVLSEHMSGTTVDQQFCITVFLYVRLCPSF